MFTVGSVGAQFEETNATDIKVLCHDSSFHEHFDKHTMQSFEG